MVPKEDGEGAQKAADFNAGEGFPLGAVAIFGGRPAIPADG